MSPTTKVPTRTANPTGVPTMQNPTGAGSSSPTKDSGNTQPDVLMCCTDVQVGDFVGRDRCGPGPRAGCEICEVCDNQDISIMPSVKPSVSPSSVPSAAPNAAVW